MEIHFNCNKVFFCLLFLGIIFLNSCISYKNTIFLRAKLPTPPVDSLAKYSVRAPDYLLKPKDILSINVSSFNPQITAFFNTNKEISATYPVQDNGYIYFPILDSIKVADLTTDQVRKNLRSAIRVYASDAFVSVDLTSFYITVLGEVGAPGVKPILRDRVTLFEVLAMSGGVTDYGDRKKVRVVRKLDDGVKIAVIDVTNEDIILSPYYYLLPGDVIYVQPMREKTIVFNIRQISLVTAFATVIYIAFFLAAKLQ